MTTQTAIIILAAGSSSRLGQPKQLLPFKGTSLIGYVASAALTANLGMVVVVTGDADEKVREALKTQTLSIAFNPNWSSGMGASIACGVKAVTANAPETRQIIITVCDQPFVDTHLFTLLADHARHSGKGIIASEYAGTVGTPVLFHSRYFEALMALDGDAGAKKLVRSHPSDVATVSFLDGDRDIDTLSDYTNLLQNNAEI